MTAKPIIFSAPMVRALLDGRKTQTRRVMKVQPQPYAGGVHPDHVAKHPAPYIDAYCSERKTATNPRGMSHDWQWWTEDDRCGPYVGKCPYIPGDLLWVRETWSHTGQGVWKVSDVYQALGGDIVYRADEDNGSIGYFPSIHMPRWASRLTLRVTNIRAERLQDISEEDARAEGCAVQWSGDMNDGPDKFADEVFREIWEELYPKDSPKAWHRNPWVWVYEFEVIRRNVDSVPSLTE